KLVDESGVVEMTASGLLAKVDTPDRLPKKWPKDPTRAGGQLKRLAPALRTIGIEVDDSQRTPDRQRQRLYTLTATPERKHGKASGASGGDEKAPPTSGNTADASDTPIASADTPRADAADAGADTGRFTASAWHTASDLHEDDWSDAADAAD